MKSNNFFYFLEINNGTLQKKESENDLDEDAEPERQQLMKNENFSTRESGIENERIYILF